MLKAAVEDSFNCISVEGHMSTNDTVLALANGASEVEDNNTLSLMIREACTTLARMIPDDGEGATHLITIDVEGTRTLDDARAIAKAVADSPLVKTAIHGADPNWGRIVSAAGYAGAAFNPDRSTLKLQGAVVFQAGQPVAFDAQRLSELLNSSEVLAELNCGIGKSSSTVWTCDLSKDYVTINADYHT
jgi:glutamate N-acetyltransferase/amino-acid N-acetyltransferase